MHEHVIHATWLMPRGRYGNVYGQGKGDESWMAFFLASSFVVIGLVQVNSNQWDLGVLSSSYFVQPSANWCVWNGDHRQGRCQTASMWASNQSAMISVRRRKHISLLMTNKIGLDFEIVLRLGPDILTDLQGDEKGKKADGKGDLGNL